MVRKITYVNVPLINVRKVKKYVFSLSTSQQLRYYSLIKKLSNNFYGSCKALNDEELAQYNVIVGEKGGFKFKAR